MDQSTDLFGQFHQAVFVSNSVPATRGIRSMGVFGGTPANGYLREGGCVFGQPLSPTSQLLNEALEPMDDEETIRMDEEPSNNVALNILPQELIWANNSAQSTTEEFTPDFISPQSEGGPMTVDQDSHFDNLLVSQCETLSAADLERNVSPFDDEISPKTYQAMVKDVYQPLPQGHSQVSFPMDGSLMFAENLSHGSQHVTTPGYISSESAQGEQLQLTSSAVINSMPSPLVAQSPMTPMTPSTPSMQCSEVEQTLSMDGSEVNIVFNSHKSAAACREWYGALVQVVPEVVKPQQFVKKEHLQIKVPDEALSLVTWCSINRSGMIRARIMQELARIIATLHQNKVAKGLCFFGGLTLSESVFVNVEPSTGEPKLHIVPNMKAFWQFASNHNVTDPNTPRLGRLQDVRQFVKILEHTIAKPVKHKEFMVSYALYNACKYCVKEGTEGDKMPVFYQRLAGHKLACIQLSQENMTHNVVCYSHEILQSCLDKLTHWQVVKPSSLSNPNTVVYGLYSNGRMMLCSEELASLHLTIDMRQLSVEKVRRMKGNPLLLALKNT